MTTAISRGIAFAAAILLLSGSAATAQTRQTTLNAVDRRFLTKAAEGNVAEVTISKLALEKSRNGEVRKVAQMLVTEHSRANFELKPIAGKHNVRLPNTPSARHRAEYRRLSRLSGAAFDREYMRGQIKDHLNTIALFRSTVRAGRDADIQAYAREYLPAIENHTVHIVRTAEQIGVRPIPAEARAYVGPTGANRR